jgi:saccharopine dehydrogenase-like NADP-dependent oxidoreductase
MAAAGNEILIVGGYGEVGTRLAAILARAHGEAVVVAGRNPDRASGHPARRIDVDDEASVEKAMHGVGLVLGCVRQREPHLLRAAARHGIAYTSIAPPPMDAATLESLRDQATRTGARLVLGAGIEPGISNVLARVGADRVGKVDGVETALVLGVGDAYGADSMAFILDEIGQRYTVLVDGGQVPTYAFERSTLVKFPEPIGTRRAYTMPFSDQPYYPATLGAQTSVARLALDPPWLGGFVAAVTRLGARRWIRGGGASAMRALVERLRSHLAGRDRFALRVEVRGGGRAVRSTLLGRGQAQATAVSASAIGEALYAREVEKPGVWLAEQVIAPPAFLERLAEHGLIPVTEGPDHADEALDVGRQGTVSPGTP